MENRYLCRAKRKNWRELPKDQWWVEGYHVELPVGSIAATIVANDEEVVCEDTESYIISIYTKQHSNYSPGFPLEVVECEQYEIDFDTLCRCTGLKDKNGKLIWENDILMCHGNSEDLVKAVFGEFNVINAETLEVIDRVIGWHYEVVPTDALSKCEPFCFSMPLTEEYVKICEMEVVDNPELLEV